ATYPGGDAETHLLAEASLATPIRSCSRWGLPCHRRCRRRGALLPHPFTLARRGRSHGRAVCFLWHFPWGRPRRALPGTVFPWSPDFPPPAGFPVAEGGHPAVWHVECGARRRRGQAEAAAPIHTHRSVHPSP